MVRSGQAPAVIASVERDQTCGTRFLTYSLYLPALGPYAIHGHHSKIRSDNLFGLAQTRQSAPSGMEVLVDERYLTVSEDIFHRFPGYVRGVVIAQGVTNGPTPEALRELLREAEESVRARFEPRALAEHPRIKSWREAYRSFGAKPSEFRSSIEALARRVLRGEPLPSINALVDIGNVVSLRHLVPAGGHAIDVLARDIELRLATGTEVFVPFGSEQVEHPLPGEVVFVEGQTVLTRRWTWRQANHTLLTGETTAAEVNIDGLPPVESGEIQEAASEVREWLQHFCGGSTRFELLSEENPRIRLSAGR